MNILIYLIIGLLFFSYSVINTLLKMKGRYVKNRMVRDILIFLFISLIAWPILLPVSVIIRTLKLRG